MIPATVLDVCTVVIPKLDTCNTSPFLIVSLTETAVLSSPVVPLKKNISILSSGDGALLNVNVVPPSNVYASLGF